MNGAVHVALVDVSIGYSHRYTSTDIYTALGAEKNE
jgi:hypothetical protein